MPANTSPIWALTPNVKGIQISANNTKSDGAGTIGTDTFIAFQAGANGSFVERVRFSPTASAAATATAATVLRVFASSANSGSVTNANMWLLAELAVAAQTADQTTTGTFFFEVPLNFALPANYTICVTTHQANNANTAWMAVGMGGDY